MIPTHLLEGVRESPDVPESRYGVLDWLLEFGEEDAWQSYLDAFPAHHDMRMRFGVWLTERGDERGEGYEMLSRLGMYPCHLRPTINPQHDHWMFQLLPHSSHQLSRHYTFDFHSPIMNRWFRLFESDVFGSHHRERHLAEDAAALAFSNLSRSDRCELLSVKVPT